MRNKAIIILLEIILYPIRKHSDNGIINILEAMDQQKLYMITDCGSVSPCYGFIFGIYNTEEAAKQRLLAVREDPNNNWMGSHIYDIEIRNTS